MIITLPIPSIITKAIEKNYYKLRKFAIFNTVLLDHLFGAKKRSQKKIPLNLKNISVVTTYLVPFALLPQLMLELENELLFNRSVKTSGISKINLNELLNASEYRTSGYSMHNLGYYKSRSKIPKYKYVEVRYYQLNANIIQVSLNWVLSDNVTKELNDELEKGVSKETKLNLSFILTKNVRRMEIGAKTDFKVSGNNYLERNLQDIVQEIKFSEKIIVSSSNYLIASTNTELSNIATKNWIEGLAGHFYKSDKHIICPSSDKGVDGWLIRSLDKKLNVEESNAQIDDFVGIVSWNALTVLLKTLNAKAGRLLIEVSNTDLKLRDLLNFVESAHQTKYALDQLNQFYCSKYWEDFLSESRQYLDGISITTNSDKKLTLYNIAVNGLGDLIKDSRERIYSIEMLIKNMIEIKNIKATYFLSGVNIIVAVMAIFTAISISFYPNEIKSIIGAIESISNTIIEYIGKSFSR